MDATATPQRRLGPIRLQATMTPAQVGIFIFIVLLQVFGWGFYNLMQPLLVTEILHIPKERQGIVTGWLGVAEQAALLLTVSVVGSWSDRNGRKIALILGGVGFSVTLFLYPLMSVLWLMLLVRMLGGLVYSAHAAGTVTWMTEIPDNRDRGKFISLILITQGLGAMLFTGFISRPMAGWYRDAGATVAEAVRYSFWTMIALTVLSVVLAAIFMPAGKRAVTPVEVVEEPTGGGLRTFLRDAGEVLRAARKSPRFGLVLLIGAVVRTDSVIFSAFLGLWMINAGRDQGMDVITATKFLGSILAFRAGISFVMPLVWGYVADRVDRLKMLIVSLLMNVAAFFGLAFVADPFGPWIYVAVLAVGLAEGCQTVAANTLFAEEAPADLRGTAMGFYMFLGASSVLLISLAGGALFDIAGYKAPFVMEGLLNGAFFITALSLILLSLKSGAYRRLKPETPAQT